MASGTLLQNSFNWGEFSPLMYGRTNFEPYRGASKVMLNWQIVPQGGLVRRSGTRHVALTKYPDRVTLIRKFIYSDQQAYQIEVGHRYLRFYRDEGVLTLQTLEGLIANTTTEEFEYAGHGYRAGDGPVRLSVASGATLPAGTDAVTDYYVQPAHTTVIDTATEVITGTETFNVVAHGYTSQMGPFQFQGAATLPSGPGFDYGVDYYIVYVDADNFRLSLTAGGAVVAFAAAGSGLLSLVPEPDYRRNFFRLSTDADDLATIVNMTAANDETTLTPQGTPAPIELASPYDEDELRLLSFSQDADVLYIWRETRPTMKISRYDSQWGFDRLEVEFEDGPYLDENVTATTLAPSAATGRITLTSAGDSIFRGSDAGRHVRLNNGGSGKTRHWGWAKIIGVSPQQFTDANFDWKAFTTGDVNVADDRIDFGSAHGIATGELVRVSMDDPADAPPAPLVQGSDYWARAVTANRMSLHPTEDDANADTNKINLTNDGDGSGRVTSALLTLIGHGYVPGDGPVQLLNYGGALPDGLSSGVDYWIRYETANVFYLAAAPGGPPVGVNRTGGGGVHSIEGDNLPSAVAIAQVGVAFDDPTAANEAWRLGAWGGRPELGYPRVGGFHGERLWAAANTGKPQTIWSSVSGDFVTFSPTGIATEFGSDLDYSVTEANAITYTLGGSTVNTIQWLATGRRLLAGTNAALWSGEQQGSRNYTRTQDPAADVVALSPANFNMARESQQGSARSDPTHVEGRVLYISASGTKVYSSGYTFETDGFSGDDVMLLSEHLGRPGLLELDYAQEPYSTAFAVRKDGLLIPYTVLQAQEVSGWSRWQLGGVFEGGPAVVESVSVNPAPTGDPSGCGRENRGHDQVWVVVKRTVNGATQRSIEFFEDLFESDDLAEDAFFVDAGLTYQGAATDTITGLTHLVGETVTVNARGVELSGVVAAGGVLTLSEPVTKAHIGLPYASDFASLRLAPAEGDAYNVKLGRIDHLVLRLNSTIGGRFGPDAGHLDDLRAYLVDEADALDVPAPLFSGDVEIPFDGGWNTECEFFLRQDRPFPFTLLSVAAIFQKSESGDRSR